jgi:Spy/CpxP family protein refolding chaperone
MKLNKSSLIPGLALALLLACPLALAQSAPADSDPLDKLESFQDQMWAKEMELVAAQRAGNIQETRSIAAEMNKLRPQIRAERRRLADSGQGGGLGPDAGSGKRWGRGDFGPGWGRHSGRHSGWGRPCWE